MQKPPPKTYSVDIPTKTYLRKYVYFRYGYPFRLFYKYNLSTLILCLLDKENFTVDMNYQKIDVRMSYMNDKIICYAPLKKMGEKGFSLSNSKIIAINRFIETEFTEELYKYCRDNIQKKEFKPGYEKSINEFATSMGIIVGIDISFDALKQAEFRYRKNLKNIFPTFVTHRNNPGNLLAIA
jgi:hypothetical protein